MPYLKISMPDLPLAKKREMASRLTEALICALDLPSEHRNRTTIHFETFRPEDMASAGRLALDSRDPDYFLELHESELTQVRKQAVVDQLTPLLLELLDLPEAAKWKIHILFREYDTEDFATGGKFLSEFERYSNAA